MPWPATHYRRRMLNSHSAIQSGHRYSITELLTFKFYFIGDVLVNCTPSWTRVCLLLFSVLATSKVISGWTLTCDTHFWWLYSAVPLGDQTTSKHHDLIFHIKSPLSWHWANQSLPYPKNAEHLARKRQVAIVESLVWFSQGSNQHGPNPHISQNGRRRSAHSVIPSGPQNRRCTNF